MNVNAGAMVPITDANQSFPPKARLLEAEDEDVLSTSARLLRQNHEAYEVLSQ